MTSKVVKRKGKEVEFAIGSTGKEKIFPEPSMSDHQSFSGKQSKAVFWITVLVSQCVGVTLVGLAWYWGSLFGGFSIKDADKIFNFHPAFMIMGLIFCYGDAMIIYRVLSFLPKPILKLIHTALHLGAILFSSLALYAVLDNHKRTSRADFYSLHSWIGILTMASFYLQFVASFVVFLFPGGPLKLRGIIMPFHRFFGVGLFIMAVATAGMGLTEKLIWVPKYTKGEYVLEGSLGNAIGLLILVFAFLIVFLATNLSFKRKPLPNEVAPSATVN